jgi:uncharacterized Zn-binding protein involved in type VI secretion
MPPAARFLDSHLCTVVTPPPAGSGAHIGGNIMIGCPTVLIGKMPAARAGDQIICKGIPPHPDTILMGSKTVFIGGMPAARVMDPTSMGGKILSGYASVIIGG